MDDDLARNVFTWNRRRYPNPEKISSKFHEMNIKFIPNVKPWLLEQNEHYPLGIKDNLFIESEDASDMTLFWKGGAGAFASGKYFDFGKESARKFWCQQVDLALNKYGYADALWNDNNEYELQSSHLMSINGVRIPISLSGRALQSLLMAKTSLEALDTCHADIIPRRRKLVVSRSGSMGIHRYAAQTWSGDNSTDWTTMKYNVSMSLQLGLGLWVGNGFDIGGFTGRRVSRELFIRWVALGVWFAGRFTIHSSSWKPSSAEENSAPNNVATSVNSPWMFPNPEIRSYLRQLIQLRHQLVPNFWSLYIEAYLKFRPLTRPIIFEFPEAIMDDNFMNDGFNFLLGDNVLVCGVFEPGVEAIPIHLPGEDYVQWVDIESGVSHYGGEMFSSSVGLLERKFGVPVFMRTNSIISTNGDLFDPKFIDGENLEEKIKRIYVVASGLDARFCVSWYEGDGEFERDEFVRFETTIESNSHTVQLAEIKAFKISRSEVSGDWTESPLDNSERLSWLPGRLLFSLFPWDNREILSQESLQLPATKFSRRELEMVIRLY